MLCELKGLSKFVFIYENNRSEILVVAFKDLSLES